ncbi:BQ2448_2524 [Microbotryum intermedium]|uniref:BQ2448_2524 protein n=1 Tax=Microbotryum intermedium TaxID=269621 RepID=A0A238FCA2_9BASI|nr:BQ2448_2524 [Microbotryum intermedium]
MSSLRLLPSRTAVLRYVLPRPLSRSSRSAHPHIGAGVTSRSSFGTSCVSSLRQSSRAQETGPVSQQPGSKTLKELGDNAKEEAQKLGHVIGGAMAGANASVGQIGNADENLKAGAIDSVKGDVQSIAGVLQKVPRDALVWGGAGLLLCQLLESRCGKTMCLLTDIPMIPTDAGTSLATVYLARSAAQACEVNVSGAEAELAMELLSSVQHLQISYGAVILSFLGAIHWPEDSTSNLRFVSSSAQGLEFAKFGGVVGNTRYVAGIGPVIVGWGSMLLLPVVGPQMALITQWAGFFGTWLLDQRATTWGWTPRWYSTYRFWLTAVVGTSILVTVAGESYFAPDEETLETRSEIAKLRSKPLDAPKGNAVDLGEFRVEKTDAAFVKFSKIDKEKEEKEAKEAAEKKDKEEKEAQRQAEEIVGREERETKAKIGRAQSS